MTQHDKISAYIDNELTHEAEQDFLISLASNETTRKAFRSELVMKNVIHQDELHTLPNRELRGAILGAVGIGGAALASSEAQAATSAQAATGIKALFATKLNALLTAGIITVSAVGGYVASTMVHTNVQAPAPIIQTAAPAPMNTTPAMTIETPKTEQAVTEAPVKKAAPTKAPLTKPATNASSGSTTTNMPGSVSMKPEFTRTK